ncbi:putative transmembrane protein [Toxoplasma gondii p89]|uniref:Putative transmembrane protein n=1 Tax=Toxoplasma gondii p89 TaxID=943119 RepID=A0A086JBN4_TOXGO|nr:putative transmembrane protein [Toxoplasma gondii p89]
MRNFLRLNRTQKTTTWFCVSCSLSPLSSLTAFGVVCLSSLDENSTVFLAGFERLTLRGLSPVARPFLSTFPGAQLRQPLRALTVCKKAASLASIPDLAVCSTRVFSRNWREAAPPFLSSFLSRLFLVFSLSTFVFFFLPRRKAKRQGTPPAKFFPGDSVWATRPAAASVEARREW